MLAKQASIDKLPKTTIYNKNLICKGALEGMELDYALSPEGVIEAPSSHRCHYFLKYFEHHYRK